MVNCLFVQNRTIGVKVNGKISVDWDGRRSPCKGCGASIGWGIVVKSGKKMCFDFDKNYTAHWATCKDAAKFKRKREPIGLKGGASHAG